MRSVKITLLILTVAALLRFVVALKLPLNFLHIAGHDDALYMRLATSIATATWLGGFDQFTLMKGPGYPVFLAISSISGLPLTATHALFQISAVAVTAWSVFRLTESRTLSIVTFLLLAFHPVAFLPEMQRVIRDQIYWGQTLMIFSLFAVLMFAPPRRHVLSLLLGAFVGSILGWAWLTREEGIWFLPGLGLLLAGAILTAAPSRPRLLSLGQACAMAAGGFLAMNAAYLTGNRIIYGSFVGVDVKERNFVSALGALQRIDSGSIRPFVPVPSAARTEAAKVSATFAPLAAVLEPGKALAWWRSPGCQVYPTTCDDFAGGWFVWAFRDAAAASGFYRSPNEASDKFGQIAADISAACLDGRLRCRRSWLDLLPPMSAEQWWSLPRIFGVLAARAAFLGAPGNVDTPPSPTHIAHELFNRYWAFLNYPVISPTAGMRVALRGWYDDAQSVEWPSFKAYSQSGGELPFVEVRRLPGAAPQTSDERGARHQLEVSFICPDSCAIAALRQNSPEIRLFVDGGGTIDATQGSDRLHLDNVTRELIYAAPGHNLAVSVRAVLTRLYGILMPLLVCAGLLATIIGIVRSVRARRVQPLLLISLAAWALVGTRIIILGLIEASAFPAMGFTYLAPALFLSAIASLLSIGALTAKAQH
jgi:hypothetical protein